MIKIKGVKRWKSSEMCQVNNSDGFTVGFQNLLLMSGLGVKGWDGYTLGSYTSPFTAITVFPHVQKFKLNESNIFFKRPVQIRTTKNQSSKFFLTFEKWPRSMFWRLIWWKNTTLSFASAITLLFKKKGMGWRGGVSHEPLKIGEGTSLQPICWGTPPMNIRH